MTLLRIPTKVSAAADRPASYGNQTISSTRPSCWIQISMVDVINVAADHQMFMTLTGELSWQRLRRLAVDFAQKTKKIALWATLSGLVVTYALELFSLSPTVETLWAEIGWSRRFSKGVGHFERRFQREGCHRPPTIVGVRKLEWLPFREVWKYPQSFI